MEPLQLQQAIVSAPRQWDQHTWCRQSPVDDEPGVSRKCKIACTLGPSNWDCSSLLRLMDAGMNICRLDFCREEAETHVDVVQRIRQAVEKRPKKQVAILLDIREYEMRTGFFVAGDSVSLKAGNFFRLVTDWTFQGDETCVAVSRADFPSLVHTGSIILAADGDLMLEVLGSEPGCVLTQVVNDCELRSLQSCKIPGQRTEPAARLDRDWDFGSLVNEVDLVAVGSVLSGRDVHRFREMLGERGRQSQVFARIETQAGLRNFEAILKASDGILLSRSGLALEMPLERAVLAQKAIISRCNAVGKPVITASQVMESMARSPCPSLAEVADVANAVLDGTDCLVLPAATSHGVCPEAAVLSCSRVCVEAEAAMDQEAAAFAASQRSTGLATGAGEDDLRTGEEVVIVSGEDAGARGRVQSLSPGGGMVQLDASHGGRLVFVAKESGVDAAGVGCAEAVCFEAVVAARTLAARLLLVVTETGLAARLLAQHRPYAPVLAVTSNEETARQMQVLRGVNVILITKGKGINERVQTPKEAAAFAVMSTMRAAGKAGLLCTGDSVVAVLGTDGDCNDVVGAPLQVQTHLASGSGKLARVPEVASSVEFLRAAQPRLVLRDGLGGLAELEPAVPALPARRCKLLCTVSPQSSDVATLLKLIDAGMDICRLNLAYGDHASHAAIVRQVREAAALRPDRSVAVQVDTRGPEIRTGLLQNGSHEDLKAGDSLKFVADYTFRGNASCVAVSFRKLPALLKPGSCVWIGRTAELVVTSCGKDYVVARVLNNFRLYERMRVNLPGVKVDLPVLQLKDRDDIRNFVVPSCIDFLAVSAVQNATDIQFVRSMLGSSTDAIRLIAKIENEEGVRNFDEIVAEADAVMLARGNLGMEIPAEKVFLLQKLMVCKCKALCKPVIISAQLLGSMADRPWPAHAEVADAANAALDGADCLGLSEATSTGRFPVQSLRALGRICEDAEAVLDHSGLQRRLSAAEDVEAAAAVQVAMHERAGLIVVLPEKGADYAGADMAGRLAAWRAPLPVVAVLRSTTVARQMAPVRGALPMVLSGGTLPERLEAALLRCRSRGLVAEGRKVVAVQVTEFASRYKVLDAHTSETDRNGGRTCWLGIGKLFGGHSRFQNQNVCNSCGPTTLSTLPSGARYRVLRRGNGHQPSEEAICSWRCQARVAPDDWPDQVPTGFDVDLSAELASPAIFAPCEADPIWSQALQSMVEGEQWEVFIPAALRCTGSTMPATAPGDDVGEAWAVCVELVEILEEKPPPLSVPVPMNRRHSLKR